MERGSKARSGEATDVDPIEIQTNSGTVRCTPEEIVPKRIGLLVKQRKILLEYLVPKHGVLAHHPIAVDLNARGDALSPASAERIARHLWDAHSAWLSGVCVEQLAEFVRRLKAATERLGDQLDADGASPRAVAQAPAREPKRERVQIVPETSKASKKSKEPDIRKIFDLIKDLQEDDSKETLTLESLYVFLADYLGFGLAEVETIFILAAGAEGDGVTFDAFSKHFRRLTPYTLGYGPKEEVIRDEVIFRKAGSLGGFHQAFSKQCLNLDILEDCEVYACTPTAQVFADECKRCLIMLGPVESSLFIRDCEDCVIWVATKQLRTRDCKRCTFFLYSKTEPVIESSQDLAFAPWAASYPGCRKHFEMLKFDPQRNFWNAIFDFTGKDKAANWRILGLDEVQELHVDPREEVPAWAGGSERCNPCPPITHELLCASPIQPEEGSGQSMANLPQCRPKLPPSPAVGCRVSKLLVCDEAKPGRPIGAQYLNNLKL